MLGPARRAKPEREKFSMGRANVSFNDHDGEVSTVSVRVATPANGAAYDAWLTGVDGLKAAIVGVTIGEERANSYSVVDVFTSSDKATNAFAQRETKWLVKFTQANGEKGSFEIPCADLSLLVSGQKLMDISAGAGLTLKTAINGIVYGRDGALVTVDEIFHVGRNI